MAKFGAKPIGAVLCGSIIAGCGAILGVTDIPPGEADGGSDADSAVDGGRVGVDGGLGLDGMTSNDGSTQHADGAQSLGDGSTQDGDAAGPQFSCGACNRQTQVCCYYENGNPPPAYLPVCDTANNCAAGLGTALRCSSAVECSSTDVCCITKVVGGHASFCQHTCNPPDGELCDPNALPINRCAVTAPCSTHNIGTWGLPATRYGTCGGVSG